MEIIPPPELPTDATTVARAIERLYSLGIRPDWWKLEPNGNPIAWRNIEAAIGRGDPYCRGVLLLGLSAPMPELMAAFKTVASFPLVKGFAVGRTIFYDVARDWLTGTIDDEAATATMASRMQMLVDAWRAARADVEQAA